MGGRGVEEAAGEHDLLRARAPDDVDQPLGTTPARDGSQSRLGQPEARVVGQHAKVGGERQLQPTAERVATEHGDHGLAQAHETLEHGVAERRPRPPHLDGAER